jgi:hypothetical protein
MLHETWMVSCNGLAVCPVQGNETGERAQSERNACDAVGMRFPSIDTVLKLEVMGRQERFSSLGFQSSKDVPG